MGSCICHSEGSVENMRGARRMVNKGGKMNGYTHGEAVLDLDTVFLLSAYHNSCPAYVDVSVCGCVCRTSVDLKVLFSPF